jgi:hypothetical protein
VERTRIYARHNFIIGIEATSITTLSEEFTLAISGTVKIVVDRRSDIEGKNR